MEIVVRSVCVYLFLWVVTRAVGRSSLGELSTFQLLLFVTMGDLVQQAVTQQDYSVTAAVLAVSTFAVLTVGFAWVNWHWPRSRRLISGVPIIVVRNGRPLPEALENERMTLDDLYAAARLQGIERIAEVELAVLETDGRVSFFRAVDSEDDGAADPSPQAAG